VERILSKDEIAELLSAVRHGEIELEQESAESEEKPQPTRLDLIRIQGQGRWRVANFDIILDSYARNLGFSLTNRLQRSVSVKRTSINTMEFEPYLQQVSSRGSIAIIRLDPLRYGGLITFSEKISFALVEILLGGASDGQLTVPNRVMTAIEINVVKGAIADACLDLEKAFQPLETLQASLVKVVSNPRLVSIVPPEAAVMVAEFEVTVNTLKGTIGLVIPLASLEPLRDKLREEGMFMSSARGSAWSAQIHNEIEEMSVGLAAQLGSVTLSVREILNFEVGDVIELGFPPGSPLTVLVENKPKLEGHAGIRKGNKAIRVTNRISNGVDHGKDRR
jgi:flagellar motor switch protein FliM